MRSIRIINATSATQNLMIIKGGGFPLLPGHSTRETYFLAMSLNNRHRKTSVF